MGFSKSRSVILLFSLLVASFLIAGCSQKVYQDNNSALGGDETPVQIEKEAAPSPVKVAGSANPDIIKLYARQGQVKSVSFDVARLPDQRAIGTYYVRGDLVRIVPTTKLYMDKKFDVVYLDMSAKTATAYCEGSGCSNKNEEIDQEYSDWEVPMPIDWAQDIQYGKIVGTVTFYNKQVTRVQYQKGALYYEAYIDNYFGYPQRVIVTDDSSFKNIVGGYEYRSMAFNSVPEGSVEHKFIS